MPRVGRTEGASLREGLLTPAILRPVNATLNLTPLVRAGEKRTDGTFRSHRTFLDLVVNGVSLWGLLGKPHDMVSVLCLDFTQSEMLKAVDRLLLKSDADLPSNRRSLFLCAECGDLGCGAISVSIKREDDRVVWADFGYENTYEAQVLRADYANVGPFEFEFHPYQSTLLSAIERLKSREIHPPRKPPTPSWRKIAIALIMAPMSVMAFCFLQVFISGRKSSFGWRPSRHHPM
jgi:hypothetical protein